MTFTNRRLKTEGKLIIDNIPIKEVNETKFLGVILDKKLNWNTQATTTKNKLATLSGLFNHHKRKLPRVTMLKIYKALAMPIMHYCLEIWGNSSKKKSRPNNQDAKKNNTQHPSIKVS